MVFELEFREEAKKDLKIAFSWYEKKQKGLGIKFFLEVEEGVKYLKKNPEAFPQKKNGFRQFPLKNFPFLIIYILEDRKVAIFSIFHTRLNPNKKPSE